MTGPSPIGARPHDALLVIAVSAACLVAVFAPTPPNAWGSIAPGLVVLAAAAALWVLDDRRSRRTLAVALAAAALNVGFAIDAVPGDVLAAAVITAAAGSAVVEQLRRRRQRPGGPSEDQTTLHD